MSTLGFGDITFTSDLGRASVGARWVPPPRGRSGVESVFSVLRGRELILLGEGFEFMALEIPRSLVGKSLAEAGVRTRTGLNVVALQSDGATEPGPPPDMPLPSRGRLLAVGTREQRERFATSFAG
jgi:hypothetical protein